jgi:uncharacterized protein YndB with AHSA1/START domain
MASKNVWKILLVKKTLFILLPAILSSCYSVKKSVENSLPLSEEIRWPDNYRPEDSRFFVHNEIEIEAAPQRVWDILTQADEWTNYYEGARDLVLLDNKDGKLDAQSVFTWNTMGLDFTSTIKEFDPPHRLSWESSKKIIRGYHAWLIIPTKTGSKLVTSEAQHGFMTLTQKIFVPNKLHDLHDNWLEEIKQIAEKDIN